MKPAVRLAVGVLAAVTAGGCSRISSDADEPDTTPMLATTPSSAPSVDEEPPSMPPNASHRATVVTNAGRIEAAVLDDELEMDVSTEAGWHSAIERDGARARVVWTFGERSVVVELRGTSSGISQQVVSSG